MDPAARGASCALLPVLRLTTMQTDSPTFSRSGMRTSDAPAPNVLVVGTLVPDSPSFHGPAFNRAGHLFQANLIKGMMAAGLIATQVIAVEPVPSIPKSHRMIGRHGRVIAAELDVRLVSFVNVQPLKAVTAGFGVAFAIVRWAWQHRGRPRLVHLFNMSMPPGAFVWAACRLTRTRVSVSVLDVWKPGTLVPDTWLWRLDFFLQRRLLPRLDGHMVVSQAIAADLLLGRAVCVIEGGFDDSQIAHTTVRAAPLPGGAFRIVLSGTLADFNGVELLLDALDFLPDDVEVIVAGKGPLEREVRRRAALDRRIVFRGFLSFNEVADLYATADLLLNTRITKTIDTRHFFPSKLLELLASGTPVVSTCTGHVETEYGDVLYLLRDETPRGLADLILHIRTLDPDARRALGARARAFVLAEKTWTRQGQRLADYLRGVVAAGGRH